MKKALIYASVASMIQQFNMKNVQLLQEMGYQVDVACNMENGSTISSDAIEKLRRELKEKDVEVYHIPIPRSVSKISDIWHSYKTTKELFKRNGYEIIHCHSPIGGLICRLAYRFTKKSKKGKMIYTAHGFHFFKGAPLRNWLLYYPIEKMCARFTDELVTINQEDYELAKKKMKARNISYVPGVGIDTGRFRDVEVDIKSKRDGMDIPTDALVLLSVGELNKNKNHEVVIRALAEVKEEKIHYVIVGKGNLHDYLKQLAHGLGIAKQVHLLGYRADIPELYKAADVCVFPSIREGLGLAAIEGMAAGLPLIVSDNRGTRDYAKQLDNAMICKSGCVEDFVQAIRCLADKDDLRSSMGAKNASIAEKYDVSYIMPAMKEIYE